MDVTPELLSRYADGEADPSETLAVEEALRTDPALAAQLEDLRLIGELFGDIEPEEVSEACTSRLHALDRVRPVPAFEVVKGSAAPSRASWKGWVAAAAAVALIAVGVSRLAGNRPQVALEDFARVKVAPSGEMVALERLPQVTLESGHLLETAADERLSFRTPEGDRVTLLPGSAAGVGDPRDGQVLELYRGTVLCSILRQAHPREVDAGTYRILLTEEAHFGVRLKGQALRPAGAGPGEPEVTVTVSKGAVEVTRNGLRQEVRAYQRVVLRDGKAVETGPAAADPLFGDLMRSFRSFSREVIPGYFTGEPGVQPIPQIWLQQGGTHVLVLTDGAAAAQATHLVLYARATRPGPALLTRVRPLGKEGEAEAVTVETPPLGRDWTVVAVPRAAFSAATARRETRRIPAGTESLVRLELRPAEADTRIEIKSSLWAERPPVAQPEEVR